MGAGPYEALAALRAAALDGRLDEIADRHGLAVVTVFGSTARQEPEPRDLDVAVATRPGAAGLDVLAVLDDLAVLTGSDDVDLMVLDGALPVARERALVGAAALYEDEPGRYDRLRTHAVVERMETAWLRELELRVLQR